MRHMKSSWQMQAEVQVKCNRPLYLFGRWLLEVSGQHVCEGSGPIRSSQSSRWTEVLRLWSAWLVIMCPVGAAPLRGPAKGAAFLLLCRTACLWWLLSGCAAASVQLSSSLTRRASQLCPHSEVRRAHRSSPPMFLHRSPLSLKEAHGKLNLQLLILTSNS